MTTRNEFHKALIALRGALKAALDDETFQRGPLTEVWRHYNGLLTIYEQLPVEKEPELNLTFGNVDIPADPYDPEYNVQAAGPVDLNLGGQDVITFNP